MGVIGGAPPGPDEVKVSGVWERRDKHTIRNEIGRQFACSEYIDQQIGRVLTKLKEMDEYTLWRAGSGLKKVEC